MVLADVYRVFAHFNRACNPADHAASMSAKDDAVEDASIATASLPVRFS